MSKSKLNNKLKLNKTKLKNSISLFSIILIIILIITFIMLIPGCKDKKNKDNKNKINEKTINTINVDHIIYTCTMHPEIKQNQPGDCPICNMKLVPIKDLNKNLQTQNTTTLNDTNKTNKGSNDSKIIYTCPMHPEIKQNQPGDCPICNMKLVPIKDLNKNLQTENTTTPNDTNKTNKGSNEPIHIHTHKENEKELNKSFNKLSFDNTLKIDYNIKLYKVKHLTLRNELKFNGYTSINESTKKSLSLNTDVWIKDTYNLFEGKYIKKGEPILKIYSLEIEQTKKELELVKNDPKLKETVLKKLNYLRISSYGYINSDNIIRSPYDCILIKKTVNPGAFVKANENIYTFVINPEIWIIAELPVSHLKDIYIGKNVLVKTYDNRNFYSTIDYIFPNSDFESKTIKIRIKSLNEINLPWNIPLEVIITETKTALFVPIDSIINKGDKKIVFKKVDKNTFKPIYINIGQYYVYQGEGYYEVIDGLKEEDEIAYSGVFLLDSEARVKGLY